ncbi:MAG: FAD-dependent oxidoreductase [Rikenellaceae bacterium]
MKRSTFLKVLGTTSLTLVSGDLFSMFKDSVLTDDSSPIDFSQASQWKYLGSKNLAQVSKDRELSCEVAVIGGGIAGVNAAVAAARHGAKVILVQNRPVLGGNASSEIHVPINGSYHFKNKFKIDRETGLVDELQMNNRYYNEDMSWSVWDHVIYDFVVSEPNITLLLNTHAQKAVMSGNQISKAICYQQSTESTITIQADIFIDASGDGQLAASAGAEFRTGREGKAEFDEKYAPDSPDGWVMGDSIQFSSRDMGRPVEFRAPSFTVKYDPSKMNKRPIQGLSCGFWWVEFGSDLDITSDTETNRHRLLAYLYGAWDYVKNSGKYPEAANLALDWVGSVPGRRESRRFMGDYILSERDLTEYRHFDDTVASAGGWSLDEHCPGALDNPDDPASFFHQRFTQFTEIPFRCLYSRNIDNLMFAGRNISVTHIALSAVRLIAMCANMGQAVGTAAVICLSKGETPREVGKHHINELQEAIMRDDVYIPNRVAADPADMARSAKISASSTSSGDATLLTDGHSRDEVEAVHHWQSSSVNSSLTLEWKQPMELSSVEIKGDTNLHAEMQIHPKRSKREAQTPGMPSQLLKAANIEILQGGVWREVASVENNLHRKVVFAFGSKQSCRAVRINFSKTWGDDRVKIFEVRCY